MSGLVDRPRLSVVVPFRGPEQLLELCLEALLSQTYPADRYDVLLVDNSADGCGARIAGRYSRLTLLRQPAPGAYAARNLGARAASGGVLVFTDADCVPQPDWLERVAAAVSDPAVQIVLGAVRPGGESGLVRLLGAYEDLKGRHIAERGEPRLFVGHAGNMAVRRETFEELGPFPELRRGADTAFVRRVVDARSSSVVRYDPAVVVRHLEISRARDYCRKVFAYGRSYRHYRRTSGGRALTNLARLRLLGQTVRQERPPALARLAFVATLLAGLCCWCAGVAVGGQLAGGSGSRL